MMTNLMTILERKVFISSNPRIVLSSCPPPCGHFSIQESASGGLSYKVKKNQEFLPLFETCKGFCIPHFGDLVETAESALSDKEKKTFYAILFPMMEQNMQRLSDDLDWFCDKFDYRNKDADWRTSKDALPRGMQKAAGGYPADEPYTMDK